MYSRVKSSNRNTKNKLFFEFDRHLYYLDEILVDAIMGRKWLIVICSKVEAKFGLRNSALYPTADF